MGALFSVLASIDVVCFGLLVLFDIEPPVKGGLRKLLGLSAWAFVVQHFGTLATALVDSLAQAGLVAAGQPGASARALLNPSAILDMGFKATEPLTRAFASASLLTEVRSIGIVALTYLLIMAAYIVLALNVLITIVEYYIALAITGVLVPFGVFGPTRWIAMKPLSYFLSCGLKLMVLSFLMVISRDVLARVYFASDEPTLREMWIGSCCALGIAMLAWFAPQRLAAGIMAGSASLGASDAIGFAAGTVMAAAAEARRGGAPGRPGGQASGSVQGMALQGGARAPAASPAAGTWQSSQPSSGSPVASAVTRSGERTTKAPVFEGEFVASSPSAAGSRSTPSGGSAPRAGATPKSEAPT
jgi:type IV secretion system protein TrbL